MSDETPDAHVDGAEPSMEDILASIRRIIADEDGLIAAEDSATPSEAAESFTIVDAGAENKIVDNALPAVAAQDLEGEALDLLLDSDDILTDFDADNELEALLQIPDSDEADSVDEIDALLEGLLFDDNAADKSVGEDDRVLDPAADMIDAYEKFNGGPYGQAI